MAHPERYVGDPARLTLAERIGRHAVLMVDLGALDGAHGRAEMKTARKLVEEGLAHAAATDIHRPDDAKGIAAGMAWIRKQFGPAVLEQLLAENTRRLLTGEMPEAPPPDDYFSSTTGAPSSTASPSLTSTADTVPATRRLHGHLHLHRFEHDDRLPFRDGVADLDLDLPHRSRDVRFDLSHGERE